MRLCTLFEGVNVRSDRMILEERLMANMTTQNRVHRLMFSMLGFFLLDSRTTWVQAGGGLYAGSSHPGGAGGHGVACHDAG